MTLMPFRRLFDPEATRRAYRQHLIPDGAEPMPEAVQASGRAGDRCHVEHCRGRYQPDLDSPICSLCSLAPGEEVRP